MERRSRKTSGRARSKELDQANLRRRSWPLLIGRSSGPKLSLRIRYFVLAVVLLGVGCADSTSNQTETAVDVAAPSADSLVAERLTASNLEPRFTALGIDGAVSEVAISFSRAVVTASRVGADAAGLVELTWQPEVPGRIRFVDAASLVFTPSAAFASATRYQVQLTSIDTVAGTLSADTGEIERGDWAFSFQTPAAGFSRVVLRRFDPDRKSAEVALLYTGAVEPRAAARSLRWSLLNSKGHATSRPRVTVMSEDPTNEVLLRITGEGVVGGQRLVLERGGADAGAPAVEIAFPGEEPFEIKSVYLDEGPSGFHIEVVCDDSAAGGRRWHWDPKTSQSWRVSSRCELAKPSSVSVNIDPPVDVQIVASSGGFRLLGDFERGTYRVRFEAGLRSIDGGVSRTTTELDLSVPARSPQLQFSGQGRYLTKSAWQALSLRHLNLARANLEVRQVPVENLAFWLGTNNERTDESNSRLVSQSTLNLDGALDSFASTPLDAAQLVPADGRGLLQVSVSGANVSATSRVLLTDMVLVAKRTGLAAAASGDQREWGSGVAVWALDADSLDGLLGVDVRVLRRNGQVLASCLTDRDGGCTMAIEQAVDPAPPFVVTATKDDDFTYLAFDELRAEVQEARVAGLPYQQTAGGAGYAAALYTERGVYRPGETAHIAAILRNRDGSGLAESVPVALKVFDPRGKLMRERLLNTNSAGFITDDVGFADFATTGRYDAVIEVAKKVVARERFQVEEFVPERLEVTVSASDANSLAKDAVSAQVDARYLFGGTPVGASVQLGCELQPVTFTPSNNAEFTYGPWQDDTDSARPLQLGEVNGQLDRDGVVQLTCPTGAAAGQMEGTAKAVLRAAVSEAGSGRATVGRAEVLVHPALLYVGLKTGTAKAGVGDTVAIEGAVVDWEGQTVTSVPQLALEFVRLERQWGRFYDPDVGHDVYRSYRRPVVEEEREVSIEDGRFQAEFTVGRAASGYLIRAKGDTQQSSAFAATELFVESKQRYYYWAPRESQQDVTPRPGRARWIALEVPEEIRAGKRFEVAFTAPFKGRALLSIETNEVLASEWIDVDAGKNVWRTRLERRSLTTHHPSGYVPNVYVNAFVVKDPHLESEEAFLPDRALGVSTVRVAAEQYELATAIEVPSEVRSNSPLRVTVDLGRQGRREKARFVSVAAVDEGILSLTQYKAPDPLAEIFPRRALGVETFETVGWTMAQLEDPASATGGDQQANGAGRVAPVRPVALWSGVREVPADGKLEVTFNVPEYRGALRVMVVSAGDERVGRALGRVLVRDPLVLQTTLPRFLIKGDAVEVPAFVTNLSGSKQQVTVEIGVDGLDSSPSDAVEILSDSTMTVTIDPDAGVPVRFLLRSSSSSGAVRLRVRAVAGDLVSTETLDVPLQPAGPRVRRTERLVLAGIGSARTEVTEGLSGWEPGSETTTFWLGLNRFADVYEHMGYLIRYPYGCLEQTTSSTRPLLSLRELLPFVGEAGALVRAGTAGAGSARAGQSTGPDVDGLVQQGVDRLFSMQTPEGGFGYWPGSSRPAYWASAYATDFLLDAAAQRFDVPQERLDQVLAWMEREAASSGNRLRDGYSDNGVAFMHYVLAKAERGKQGLVLKEIEALERRWTMHQNRSSQEDRYREFGEGQYLEERYLLQAALYLAGDHRFEADLRRPSNPELATSRNYGWSFYSDRRRRGLMLSVAVDLFGNEGAAIGTSPFESLAQTIASALRGQSRSYTTQDLVWGLTGLAKYSRGSQTATTGAAVAPELWVDGVRQEQVAAAVSSVANVSSEGTESAGGAGQAAANNWSWTVPRASQRRNVEVRVPGLGSNGLAETQLYLQVSSFGVRSGADQPGPGSSGLTLERRFRRASGALFDPSSETVALGEVVTVELEIRNRTGETVTNLALTDRVPAGLEIENPRLGRGGDGSGVPWLDQDRLWAVDHLEIRDDRIEAFGPLERRQTVLIVYAARATAAGQFTIPMPSVEAMYNPDVWSRAAASSMTVTRAPAAPAGR